MSEFPAIQDLADASEDRVLRLWQGLGYYSRARNLHATAKIVSNELHGRFPDTYQGILKLKGVGPYTAAAIASICFNEATPVVDGNVFRFASRYFGIQDDISIPKTRKVFEKLLEQEIDQDQPGTFNQAMMEFGATVCTPLPKCVECGFQAGCFALLNKLQQTLPVKSKRVKTSTRYFNYFVFRFENSFLLKQRGPKDVWQGLYDFYLVEGDFAETTLFEMLQSNLSLHGDLMVYEETQQFKHILTHQKLLARFFEVELTGDQYKAIIEKDVLTSYSVAELLNLPKPKLIVNYLSQTGLIT